jgi:hypothetical protein
MKRPTLAILSLIGGAVLSPSSFAQGVKIVGLGSSNCAQYLTDIKNDVPAEREYFTTESQQHRSGVATSTSLRANASRSG